MDLASILTRLDDLEDDLATCLTTTAPSMPLSCVAVLNGGGLSATITFTTPMSDGGSPITGYTAVATPGGANASGGTSPLVVSGINGNLNGYTFEVRALNAVGHSVPCVTNGIGQIVGPVPSAPLTVTAALKPGNPLAANVSFTVPVSDGGNPILYYSATSSPGGLTGVATSSPVCVPNLTGGTTYTFTVRAHTVNGAGIVSAASNPVTASAPLVYGTGSLQSLPKVWIGNTGRSHDGNTWLSYSGLSTGFPFMLGWAASNGLGRTIATYSAGGGAEAGGGYMALSDDGGDTWRYISTALTAGAFTYHSIAYGSGGIWMACPGGAQAPIRSLDNGETWSAMTVPSMTSFSAVAYGGSGLWVGVGAGTNTHARSVDNGATWTSQNVVASHNTLVYGDGTFVSTQPGGTIRHSLDGGITWVATPFPSTPQGAAYGDGRFIVLSASGTYVSIDRTMSSSTSWALVDATAATSLVLYHGPTHTWIHGNGRVSYDGVHWYNATTSSGTDRLGHTALIDSVVSSDVQWVACGTGTAPLVFSYDGLVWAPTLTTPFSTSGHAVASSGTAWVAGGEGTNTLATSSDGRTFTGLGLTVFSTRCRGVAFGGGVWMAVGEGTNQMARSTDNGTTWTVVGSGIFTTSGYSVGYSAFSGTWIATGEGTNSLARSVDGGLTWTGQGTTVFTTRGKSVAAGLNFAVTHSNTIPYWVVVGEGANSLATSINDGQTWLVQTTSPFTTRGNALVTDGCDFWMAVGEGTDRMYNDAGTDGRFRTASFATGVFALQCAAFDGEMYVVGTSDATSTLLFKDHRTAEGTLWVSPYNDGGLTSCLAVASRRPLTDTPSLEYVGMQTSWVGSSTSYAPIHSSDGIHWHLRHNHTSNLVVFGGVGGGTGSDSTANNLREVRYNGVVWVSANGYYSNDGLHWIPIITLATASPDDFSGVAFNGARWIVCSSSTGLWRSDDGLFYQLIPSGVVGAGDAIDVAYGVRSTDGAGVWVAATASGPLYVYSLDNGQTWSPAKVKPPVMLADPGFGPGSITYGGGRFILMIFSGSTMFTSLDGEVWCTMNLTPSPFNFADLRYAYGDERWLFQNSGSATIDNRVYVSDTGEPSSFFTYLIYAIQAASSFAHHETQDVWVSGCRPLNSKAWMGHSLDGGITWHGRATWSRGASVVLGTADVRAVVAPRNAPSITPPTVVVPGVLMVSDGSVGGGGLSLNHGLAWTASGAIQGRRQLAYEPGSYTWAGFNVAGDGVEVRRGLGAGSGSALPALSPALGTSERIASGNGKFVQCFSTGSGAPLAWSWSGRRWFTVATTALSTSFAVAYDAVAGRWLAVTNAAGATGSGSQAMISDDGAVTWSDTSTSLNVASTPTDATKSTAAWVVTWLNGTLSRSVTAVGGWATVGAGTFTTSATCIDTDGTKFVAGGSGTNLLAYSVDGGTTWLPCVVPGTFWATTADIVYAGASAGMWFACGSGGSMIGLAYSFDGQTWFTQNTWLSLGVTVTTPASARLVTNRGIRVNQEWNILLSSDGASIFYSEDGFSWSSTNPVGPTGPLTNLAFDGTTSTYLVSASGTTTTSNMARSPDGIRWTPVTTVMTGAIQAVVLGAGTWVAVGTGTHSVMHSTNGGVTWTGQGVTLGATVNCLTFGAGRFVAGSATTGLWHSATGMSGWTAATGVTYTGPVYEVHYNATANRFVAVGTTATGTSSVAYSDDGMTWTSVGSIAGSVLNLHSLQVRIQYANGTWVIGVYHASASTAWYSTNNGLTWKNCLIDQNDASALGNGLVYSPTLGLWFAFRSGLTSYYVSADGISWTLRTATNLSAVVIHGALGR